jgi:hypothetical protein
MTKKTIEISLLNDLNIDDVISFHNSIYNENRTREKFLWEFHNAPSGKAIYVIAKDIETQKIVGTQCAIPIELTNADGSNILTAKSEDTLVDPDYRGLQIFEKMYQLLFEECKKQNIKYLWGFTSAIKPFLKLGFSIPFSHSQSLMVFRILPSYRYLNQLNTKNKSVDRLKILALCLMSTLFSFKRHFYLSKEVIQNFKLLIKDKESIVDPNEFLNVDLDNYFSIKQDPKFYNWRIANNPYHEKIIKIAFLSKSKAVGNILFNHHKNGVWYLINDFYSKELSDKQKENFLKEAINILLNNDSQPVNMIRTWDFSHNVYHRNEIELRKKTGFFHLDKGISFVWKSLDENDTLDPNNFILSRLASQGVI